jgi:DNA invertase Pin-like site-specific DNA recombinase
MTIHPIIKPRHLERTAYVYLRQSSPGQVRKNREGRLRQQAMVDHVATLGWPPALIVLLDGDTGQSGSSQHGRADFQTLTEAIVTDKAGLVAARELSRLVRDNQDWAQLVRLCRFQDVLLADEYRLYDPANPQDRMVLGIQGAFNEFELSMILDRMQQSLRQKAQRGEQYDALPPGYICRQPPLCEKHPDLRVQRAIKKVLKDFERFPGVNQLYLHLEAEGFQLPKVPHGRDWRDVEWVDPSYSQILRLVGHPVYAGIYVRGRSKVFITLDELGHKQTKSRRVPREEWDVFLEDHHEAYIPKSTWERNMEKIAANANVRGDLTKGAVGRGESLMAGLLRCRRCGHRLRPRYPQRGVRYFCAGGQRQRKPGAAKCLNFYGADLETLLAEEILEVVGPAGVEAAQRAALRLAGQYQQQRQLLVDRVEATREAEARAAREYKQTDVTYTAVRQALGAEWETTLARVTKEELCLATFDERQPTLPTPAQRKQLAHLGEDVQRLWSHPRASNSLKQQLARVLIKEIVVDVDDERDEVMLVVQWSGGHHTELRGQRTPRRGKLPSSDLKSVIETLRKVHPDGVIASALNRTGIRTTRGKTWTRDRVERYRRGAGISAYDAKLKTTSSWLTQSETATRLEISPMSVHRLVSSGILPAEQPQRGLPMVITATDLSLLEVEQAVMSLQAGHIRPLPDDPRQLKLF